MATLGPPGSCTASATQPLLHLIMGHLYITHHNLFPAIAMDPLSIAAASASLAGLCAQVTAALYSFASDVQNVDNEVRVLGVEIDSLTQVLNDMKITFDGKGDLDSQTGNEGHYWKTVKCILSDCSITIRNLDSILDEVKKEEGQVLRRLRMKVGLKLKSSEIASLRKQIGAYRQTLQLSLGMIAMYVSAFYYGAMADGLQLLD
jgi:thiamine transporter ThiT